MNKGQLLGKAIQLAVEAHTGQYDRAGAPYILHVLKVMHYTKSEDEEVQAIAVLHDSVEDNKNFTFLYLLEQGMTLRVVEGVRALTKMPGQTLDEYKVLVKRNPDATLVKLADLRHNSDIRRLKGITQKDIERTARYHQFYLELKQAQEQNVLQRT